MISAADVKTFASMRVRRQLARLPVSLPPLAAHGENAIIASWLRQLGNVDRSCVDIAASDGVDQSNTFALYREGWTGLAVEADPVRFRALAAVHARTAGIGLARVFVTPENVVELLRAHGITREFGFLSFDIDGYDAFVLDALLDEFRPSLICAEINEKIPPPLKFTVLPKPGYEYRGDHFFGQSIAELAQVAERHEYDLVQLQYNNAFLVPRERGLDCGLTADEAYRRGYADQPDRRERFPYNADVEPLQTLAPAEAMAFLDALFADRRGEYRLSI